MYLMSLRNPARLKRFPSNHCIPAGLLLLNESAYRSYSMLVPQLYVKYVWGNMPLCFIGLQIKRSCTWGTSSWEPNLPLDLEVQDCPDAIIDWDFGGLGEGHSVFCIWECCELLWPEWRLCYIVLSWDCHSNISHLTCFYPVWPCHSSPLGSGQACEYFDQNIGYKWCNVALQGWVINSDAAFTLFSETVECGCLDHHERNPTLGFPGGTALGSPPANAGDTGSSPGPGGSRMPWSSWAREPQLLGLRSRAREPQLLSPRATTAEAHAPGARALQRERPPQWEACALQWGVAPARRNWRGPARSNEDPTQPKIKKKKKKKRNPTFSIQAGEETQATWRNHV